MTIYIHAGLCGAPGSVARALKANAKQIGRDRLPQRKAVAYSALVRFGVLEPLLTPDPERQGSDVERAAARDALAQVAPRWGDDAPVLAACDALGRLTRPEDIGAVHDLLAPLGHDVRIIFHLEPQERLLERVYGAYVLAGGTAPLLAAPDHPLPAWFDYAHILGLWSDAFGPDALIVRRAPEDGSGLAVLRDLLEIVGVTPNEDLVHPGMTELAAAAAELLRRINLHLADMDDPGAETRRMAAATKMTRIGRGGDGSGARMTAAAAAALRARFAVGNIAVIDRFAAGQTTLFPPLPESDPATSVMSDADVATIAGLTAELLGGQSAQAPGEGVALAEKTAHP